MLEQSNIASLGLLLGDRQRETLEHGTNGSSVCGAQEYGQYLDTN